MTKKIDPLSNWISASVAAQLLSDKMDFPVPSRYIRQLAKRKRNPVRTETLGYHKLYNRDDILASTVKKKELSDTVGSHLIKTARTSGPIRSNLQ